MVWVNYFLLGLIIILFIVFLYLKIYNSTIIAKYNINNFYVEWKKTLKYKKIFNIILIFSFCLIFTNIAMVLLRVAYFVFLVMFFAVSTFFMIFATDFLDNFKSTLFSGINYTLIIFGIELLLILLLLKEIYINYNCYKVLKNSKLEL